jgi:translation initiation factor 2B subunit (eIF-2B alpha/beta/delta family)
VSHRLRPCPFYDGRVADAFRSIERIAADCRSGAAELARAAALALQSLEGEQVRDAIEMLLRGHPSMAPLWRLASDVLSAGDPLAGVAAFLPRLDADRDATAQLAELLSHSNFRQVLTISWSSSVLAAIRLVRPETVLCMRSEPGGEGPRLAEALAPFTAASVIEDDEAIAGVPAEVVVTGADALFPGAVVNKVKTRALAEAAGMRGVPVYAIAGETKFVAVPLPLAGAFESTPVSLFIGIATAEGILSPPEASDRARAAALHEDLTVLLERLRDSGAA